MAIDLRLVMRRGVVGGKRVHQVARHLGLAVDGDDASRERLKIDAVTRALESDADALVHEAFAMAAPADAGRVQKVDRAALEHSGADAAEHIFGAAALQHDVVDAGPMQEPGEEQPRWAGTDNCDLGVHQPPASDALNRRRHSSDHMRIAGVRKTVAAQRPFRRSCRRRPSALRLSRSLRRPTRGRGPSARSPRPRRGGRAVSAR